MPEQKREINLNYNANIISSPHKLEMLVHFSGTPIQLHMNAFSAEECNDWPGMRHSNTDFELHILLGGSAILEVEGDRIPMSVGTAALITPGSLHQPSMQSDDLRRFTLRFFPQRDSELYNRLCSHIGAYTTFQISEGMTHICETVLQEFLNRDPFAFDCMRGLYLQLLSHMMRCIGMEAPEGTPDGSEQSTQDCVIMDRFFFPWPYSYGTEKDLAELLHISTRQLHRVLMRNYGMSFRQKLLHSRMEYAGSLLQATDERVADIAVQVGYKEESSFFKAFQAHYGMTPQQYRQRTKRH